ncbi:hypothetical protein HID58_018573, partial [Brassica napus]
MDPKLFYNSNSIWRPLFRESVTIIVRFSSWSCLEGSSGQSLSYRFCALLVLGSLGSFFVGFSSSFCHRWLSLESEESSLVLSGGTCEILTGFRGHRLLCPLSMEAHFGHLHLSYKD